MGVEMQLQIREKGKVRVKTAFPTFYSSHVSKCFCRESDSQCVGNKNCILSTEDFHLFNGHSIIVLIRKQCSGPKNYCRNKVKNTFVKQK